MKVCTEKVYTCLIKAHNYGDGLVNRLVIIPNCNNKKTVAKGTLLNTVDHKKIDDHFIIWRNGGLLINHKN